MRVLITGHDGYIGAVMIPVLQEEGHELVGLDSHLFEECALGDYESPIPSLRCDLRDVTADQLEGFDAVIHLAAISNDPFGDLNPGCTYDINHKASARLGKLAKEAGVKRFLYSSSCSIYGAASPEDELDETASFAPITAYAESKVLVESELSSLADDSFTPTYLRNATVYGVSPRLRGDLVVNNLVRWAYTTGNVHLMSDGTPWRPLIHVEDVARAFACILKAPKELVHDQAFNVGGQGENYQIRDVAELVQKAVPDSKVTFAEGAGPDPRCYRVDFSKVKKTLNFETKWDVKRGVAQLFEAFRRENVQEERKEGDSFVRVQHISKLLNEGRLQDDLRWSER